jgi:hypothetical protein
MKKQTLQGIVVSVALGLLSWIGVRLTQIYETVKSVPIIEQDLKEFHVDQAENNKTYNWMLYNINLKLHDDSIKEQVKKELNGKTLGR